MGAGWRGAVICQVYAHRAADGTGDGVGDLIGVRDHLPYLAGLGVEAIWPTPFPTTPMTGFGYDMVDHRDVDGEASFVPGTPAPSPGGK